MKQNTDQLRESVRRKYYEIAISPDPSGWSPACCEPGGDAAYSMIGDAYDGGAG